MLVGILMETYFVYAFLIHRRWWTSTFSIRFNLLPWPIISIHILGMRLREKEAMLLVNTISFFRRVFMKMEFSSQRGEMPLFLTTAMPPWRHVAFMRIIHLTIQTDFTWWSYPWFLWPVCVIQLCYLKEKIDSDHTHYRSARGIEVTPPFLPLFHTLTSQWESLTLYKLRLPKSGHWSKHQNFSTVGTSRKRPLPPCGMTILKFVIVFNPLPASTCHLCALYIPRYSEFQHGTARILTRNLYAIIFFFISRYVRPLPERDPLCFDPRKIPS